MKKFKHLSSLADGPTLVLRERPSCSINLVYVTRELTQNAITRKEKQKQKHAYLYPHGIRFCSGRVSFHVFKNTTRGAAAVFAVPPDHCAPQPQLICARSASRQVTSRHNCESTHRLVQTWREEIKLSPACWFNGRMKTNITTAPASLRVNQLTV